MASVRRKSVAVALAFVGVAGLSLASAAQLGVTSTSLGAGTSVVASCDTDGIGVAYTTTFDAASGAYRTGSVVLSGMAAGCTGAQASITLSDGTAALATVTGVPVTGADQTFTLPSSVSAAAIQNAAVVIAG